MKILFKVLLINILFVNVVLAQESTQINVNNNLKKQILENNEKKMSILKKENDCIIVANTKDTILSCMISGREDLKNSNQNLHERLKEFKSKNSK